MGDEQSSAEAFLRAPVEHGGVLGFCTHVALLGQSDCGSEDGQEERRYDPATPSAVISGLSTTSAFGGGKDQGGLGLRPEEQRLEEPPLHAHGRGAHAQLARHRRVPRLLEPQHSPLHDTSRERSGGPGVAAGQLTAAARRLALEAENERLKEALDGMVSSRKDLEATYAPAHDSCNLADKS